MVEGESEWVGARTIKGHTFHFPRLIDHPFVATNFYAGSSIELLHQGDIPGSVLLPDGREHPFTFDRDLAFAQLNYGVDFRLFDFLSVGLDADYVIEVGANEETLFTYGGHTGFDFRPNVRLRLLRSNAFGSELSVRAHATVQQGIRAMPQGLLTELAHQVAEIAKDPERQACLIHGDFACALGPDTVIGESITISRWRYGGGIALAYAQAINRYLGGQIAAGLEGAAINVTTPHAGPIDSAGLLFYAGAAPALNMYPKLPMGLVFEYRFELDARRYQENVAAGILAESDVVATSHRLGFGIHYTGRRDLMLGWMAGFAFLEDATRALHRAPEEPRAFVFAAQFDMRYFF